MLFRLLRVVLDIRAGFFRPSTEEKLNESFNHCLAFAAYATTGTAHAAVSSSTADGKSASVQADEWSPGASGIAPDTRVQVRRSQARAV
jgi:hypothetical protein